MMNAVLENAVLENAVCATGATELLAHLDRSYPRPRYGERILEL